MKNWKDASTMSELSATQTKSPRILIVRLSAIGDVIHTMPVACALREHFPGAFIAWMVEGRSAELLRGHEAIDELVVVPRGWLKSPRAVWQLRRQLRAMKLDTVIETQGLSKSALGGWLSGARRRIGLSGRWGREISPWLNTELVNGDDLHAIHRNLVLLTPLGIVSPTVRFGVPDREEDRAVAEDLIKSVGVGEKYMLVVPGAGWPSKLWPAERFAAVAAHVGKTWKLPSMIIWGNAEERARADEIAATSQGHARAAAQMTLGQLAALARGARLCVGSDTGPLHLAAAVGTPCVGLYGPWPADKHGPLGPQHILVQKMCCTGTTRERRHASAVYMEAIDVASVCQACDRILSRDRASAHGQ